MLEAQERLEVQPLTMTAEEAEWFAEMRRRAEEAAAAEVPCALMLPADLLGPDALLQNLDGEPLKRWRESTLPVRRYDGEVRLTAPGEGAGG